jgi:hypothetical protein
MPKQLRISTLARSSLMDLYEEKHVDAITEYVPIPLASEYTKVSNSLGISMKNK